jgi:hypothetical protein
MDDQLFRMMSQRFDSQDAVLKEIKDHLEDHVNEDRQVWQEVWFVKKLLYGAWVGILGLLGWKSSH